MQLTLEQKKVLNEDISQFPQVFSITDDMHITKDGVSRLVFMDRYTFKDIEKKTLKVGDFVILTVKEDPKFPSRGYGRVLSLDWKNNKAEIKVDEEFVGLLEEQYQETGVIEKTISSLDKPLEYYWEQVAKRVAKGLASVEKNVFDRETWFNEFYHELVEMNFVPAGRVLYGAGSDADVTYFNCYVMPYPQDSRGGISKHREEVMEIMSRGGGVGTNGSTLRPRDTLAKGVNGKSSGSVSWLDDIASLTHLVSQGGSRRGAQMIMLASWAPDVLEFIISKMQNPDILRYIISRTHDETIKQLAQDKLKFTPFTTDEINDIKDALSYNREIGDEPTTINRLEKKLADGGTYSVHNPEFLSGANISVCLTEDFMEAVDHDTDYELKFPDIENYTKKQMKYYNKHWHECGDVREWEHEHKMPVKVYKTIRAKEMWDLINICATYSAEPGIFFIDNANDMTNAKAYGQKVVATNPCGEQPLAPMSVCNLAAVNLANMVNKETKEILWDKLMHTVSVGVRMQDNVIDKTPYFLEGNKKQALGERRVGLGVMGLHDMLIYAEKVYGSEEGNNVVDEVFKTIATTSYETSIDIAKEKGSFPFLTDKDPIKQTKLRNAFVNTGYMKKMPIEIRAAILEHGIRNSHLLTVAPTGSTGTMVGVSTGLEPYFGFKYYRSGRLGAYIEVEAPIVQEYLDKHPEVTAATLPEWFITAMELSPEAHVDVQCIIQRWIDSSLSKTVNAPKGYRVDQVKTVYERLWHGGAKGGTVYVDGSRNEQVLNLIEEEKQEAEVKAAELETAWGVNLDNEKEQAPKAAEIHVHEERTIGSEVGNTCPICRVGEVIDSGGCNTCSNCGAALKCGL